MLKKLPKEKIEPSTSLLGGWHIRTALIIALGEKSVLSRYLCPKPPFETVEQKN